MKKYAERKDGVFSTDEVDRIVQQCLPLLSSSSFVKYPGSFTIRRAFLYSLTCKENTSSINLNEFLAGCNRFGLDNPAPTIQKRIGMYGNEEDIEELLKKQLEGYSINQQLQMHTVRNKHNFVRIEPARIKSNDSKEILQSDIISSNSQPKQNQNAIMNLKLLGQAHNQLESNVVSGSHKVRINVGKVTAIKEKLLQSIQNNQQ